MCIIAYKPKDIEMPDKQILLNCFNRNPDGAGYMFAEDNKVKIKKGFMSFSAFYNDLMIDYDRMGKGTDFVLHFRIGTQGGNIPANTHPFAISENVEDLKELYKECDVALAHNGIINLTSNYLSSSNTSDTMDFITDYLSCIIREGDWYKQKSFEKNVKLIEKLIGYSNKLAIMSNDGHTELIGNFIQEKGIFYSNTSYEPSISYLSSCSCITYDRSGNIISTNQDEDYEEDFETIDEYASKFFSQSDGWYHFDERTCPFNLYDIDDYCFMCVHFAKCMYDYDVNERDCVYGRCEQCQHCRCCPNSMLNTPIEGQTKIEDKK